MLLIMLLITFIIKASQKFNPAEILTWHALFAICNRVTTLHSCYMKDALVFSQLEARNLIN